MGPRLLAFGEALIDQYPDRSEVAGAPLHVAVRLAAAGFVASFVTRVGQDDPGREIATVLERCGVETSLLQWDPDAPTGRVSITYGQDGHRFTIHRPAAWDRIALPPALPDHDVLYYGSLAGRAARSRAALLDLLSRSGAGMRVFDVNLRPPDVRDDVLRAGVAAATLVKAGPDELERLGEAIGVRPDPAELFASGPELAWLCITRGAEGAELHSRGGGAWSVAAPEVEVVDTVGAGDAFTAGLVEGLAREESPPRALARAREASASVLGRRGALPDCAGA